MEIIYIILTIIILISVLIIVNYNALVTKRNDVKSIYSSIDVQLNQRYDLIPNLVSSVKAYFKHESITLENIVKLREKAINSNDDKQKFSINDELSKAIHGLNIQIESYPNLKANENVANLQNAIKECEEQISATRRAYNSAVTSYNNACESFPSNLIANAFNFKKANFYETSENVRKNPNVKDLFNE